MLMRRVATCIGRLHWARIPLHPLQGIKLCKVVRQLESGRCCNKLRTQILPGMHAQAMVHFRSEVSKVERSGCFTQSVAISWSVIYSPTSIPWNPHGSLHLCVVQQRAMQGLEGRKTRIPVKPSKNKHMLLTQAARALSHLLAFLDGQAEHLHAAYLLLNT